MFDVFHVLAVTVLDVLAVGGFFGKALSGVNADGIFASVGISVSVFVSVVQATQTPVG
jgi:hypothetical protein